MTLHVPHAALRAADPRRRRRPVLAAVAAIAVGAATALVTITQTSAISAAGATPSYSPYGHLDRLSPTSGGMRVVGWTIDPSSQSRALTVYTTLDGRRATAVVAGGVRTDVAKVHPSAGAAHGFAFTVPAREGRHTVCVWATNLYHGADTRLGCSTRTLDFGPHGAVTYLRPARGGLQAAGYLVDGDAWTTPVQLSISVDGRVTTLVADRPSTAVPATWPTRGTPHGFSLFLPTAQGSHTVCVSAKNIGIGTDNSFGCRTVVLDERPTGYVDTVSQRSGALHIRGWTYDVDKPTTALALNVIIDGRVSAVTANGYRPDVGTAHRGVGSYHGFDFARTLPEGTHTVTLVARNLDLGSDRVLTTRSVRLNFTPTAALMSLVASGDYVRAQGWTIDPDRSAPINVRLTVDGHIAKTALANHQGPRGAQYAGRNFGEYVRMTSGGHTVCATGLNVLWGTHNSAPSCRRITMTLSPHGHYDSATRVTGSNSVRIAGWAYDPDTSGAIPVAVSIDGRPQPNLSATAYRPDVAKAYPGVSSAHGFAATYPLTDGEHRICTAARNVSGGTDLFLGCKIVIAVHPASPSAPRYLKPTGGYGNATVSWTPPASDGGAPPSSYVVRVLPGVHQVTVSGAATKATVSGLAVKGHYYFQVYARNVAGSSPVATSPWFYTAAGPAPQRTPAPVTTSRYIRNIRGSSAAELVTMRAEGRADATRNPSNHRYLVLLDIGGQDYYDGGVVLSATTRFVPNANLVRDLNAYVDGYHSAQHGTAPVTIAIGTNNDMDVSYNSGRQWATAVVNPVASHAATYAGMSIAGANDIEPGFRAGYTATRSWLSGYLAATSRPFVFNGSADGCAWTVTGRGCNNGWSMFGLYTLAAGAAPTRTVNLPQVYNTTMAAQWKYISLTGVVSHHPRINFGGPLTELAACRQANSCGSLSGYTAWQTMWRLLESDARLRQTSLPYATDLRIDW